MCYGCSDQLDGPASRLSNTRRRMKDSTYWHAPWLLDNKETSGIVAMEHFYSDTDNWRLMPMEGVFDEIAVLDDIVGGG
jgi:hypothetical protein